MDRIGWYLRGLLAPLRAVPHFRRRGDELLGQVEHAAASYDHAVNVVLSADQASAVAVWGQRRHGLRSGRHERRRYRSDLLWFTYFQLGYP